jgi:RNA polymerase sigma-70 factor (ECF subfamily)
LSREETDDDLLRAAASGSERAFGLLVARHIDRVRSIAKGFTGNLADADDIAQEVFLTVWRKAASWEPGAARFTTWVYRITANKCIDRHRRMRLRRWIGLEAVESVLASDDDPERTIAGRGALEIAMRAMANLPDRQRMAIVLSVAGEQSNAEIAEAMGLSVGAVEQLLVRARRALRNETEG